MNRDKLLAGVKLVLEGLGEEPSREGLIDTPRRICDMVETFAQMAAISEEKLFEATFNVENYSDFVLIKNISFSSFCEHHLLPFFGHVSIAYMPSNNVVVGLSKIARIVDKYSKRLQLQERMTSQIADAISKNTSNDGVIVMVDAHHICMGVRGTMKLGCSTITRTMTGKFLEDKGLTSQVQQIILARRIKYHDI